MRKWLLIVFALLLTSALPVFAQSENHTVVFDEVSILFPSALGSSVNIVTYAGSDPALDAPGGPQPPYTEFHFYSQAPAPESLFDQGGVRVYRVAELASYPDSLRVVERLQAQLAERPDLAASMVAEASADAPTLPFLPILPAGQVIRAQAQYVETPTLQGIAYITAYRQDAFPFVSADFLYTYQAVTRDGSHYVSVIFPLATGLFPETIPADFDYDAFIAELEANYNQAIATLNSGGSADFAPALDLLAALIQDIEIAPADGDAQIAPPPTLPTATPVPTPVADASLGGLAGNWVLTGFGDPAAPQTPVEGAPINATFSVEGLGGRAGCNSYSANFQYNNFTLTISPIISTLMACEESIMQVETAYLNALQTATRYEVSGETLRIFYEGGELTFTAVE
jgi:heat shock protein HslJ